MDHAFEPAPRRCADLVCRRSGSCRRPFASACLTSPNNAAVRRQRLVEKLEQFLRDSGIDPDGPPPPNALPIEETLALIRDEVRRRKSTRPPAPGRRGRRASPASPPKRRG